MTDLHAQLKAELDRRLAVARAAAAGWYIGELEVLERHAACTDENCCGGDCHRCVEFHPCSELMSLASRLGMPLTAPGTPG
jgi:hypothetical protein